MYKLDVEKLALRYIPGCYPHFEIQSMNLSLLGVGMKDDV